MTNYLPHTSLKNLVNHLVKNNLLPQSTSPITQAFLTIDRANFLPPELNKHAYDDNPVPIQCSQTLSAPHMHANAASLLSSHLTNPNAIILDVGSGSGYLSAIFAQTLSVQNGDGKVLGIEYFEDLTKTSKSSISKNHDELFTSNRLLIIQSDGWNPTNLPSPFIESQAGKGVFDAIHVGAAAASLPKNLVKLLKPGGTMVIPLVFGEDEQWFCKVEKDADGKAVVEKLFKVRYVPLIDN